MLREEEDKKLAMMKKEEEDRLRRLVEEKKQSELEEKRRRLAEVEQKRQAADKVSKVNNTIREPLKFFSELTLLGILFGHSRTRPPPSALTSKLLRKEPPIPPLPRHPLVVWTKYVSPITRNVSSLSVLTLSIV